MEINSRIIHRIAHKCKAFFADDLIFSVLIIVLISVASFGLGRLSLAEKINKGNQTAVVREATVDSYSNTSEAVQIEREESTTIYIGSKNSDKYHLPWCPGAKAITEANKISWTSQEEARAAGYSPAANCEGL